MSDSSAMTDPLAPPSTVSSNNTPTRKFSLPAVILIFLVPALGGFLFGYDIGATSYVIVQITSSLELSGVEWWSTVRDSAVWQGIIVSAASFGALIGSVYIFGVADKIGRRKELQWGAILYMSGAALEALSRLAAGGFGGLALLLIGRLVYGFGIGVAMHAAPTYLGEMGPASIRGLLVSLKEACIVLGILVGYSVGFGFSEMNGGWVYTYATSIIFAVLMLGLSFSIPRSCRWLLLQHREQEALESLKFVFLDHEYAEEEFATMKRLHTLYVSETTTPPPTTTTMNATDDSDEDGNRIDTPALSSSMVSLWKDPNNRAPLLAGVGLVVLQQVTGQPSVLSYATPIFASAGLSNYSSILVAVFKLFATLGAASTVEQFGRKKLLYTGCSLMLCALVILAFTFGGGESSTTNNKSMVNTIILCAMFVYIGGYQVGFGPITWLMTSEIFPLDARGQAVAIAVQMNFLLNAIVQFGVPVLERLVGLGPTFAIFAILDAYSIYFVKVHVPETKGLTLEEIEQQFARMRAQSETAPAETEQLLSP